MEAAQPGRDFARSLDTVGARLLDVVPVATVVVCALAALGSGEDAISWTIPLGAAAVLVPLLLRRRFPLAVLGAIIAVTLVSPTPGFSWPATLLATAYVAWRRPGRVALAAGLATLVVLWLYRPLHGESMPAIAYPIHLALVALALALGHYLAARHASLEALEDRARRAERERELLAEQAVAAERLRIARELHDIVAHNVSLMVVQARAMGIEAGDPRAVRKQADAIAALGREAMGDMRHTLELLRVDDTPSERAPQPGLDRLAELLDRTRAAGVNVRFAVEGEARPVAPAVDLSAYRIVQEALTNVVKHARSAPASVTVAYRPRAVELRIQDEGPGPLADGSSRGHGLIGMRERVSVFGGTLSAGPLNGRGYLVVATLPYEVAGR